MYVDHEGHMIATTTADAHVGVSAHELAAFYGYDCSCARCAAEDAAAYAEEL